MILLLLIILGTVVWSAISLGLLPSPFSRTLIRIRGGDVRIEKGMLKTRAREHVGDVVRESGVDRGFITVSRAGVVRFSHGFPDRLRQTVRNILLN